MISPGVVSVQPEAKMRILSDISKEKKSSNAAVMQVEKPDSNGTKRKLC